MLRPIECELSGRGAMLEGGRGSGRRQAMGEERKLATGCAGCVLKPPRATKEKSLGRAA